MRYAAGRSHAGYIRRAKLQHLRAEDLRLREAERLYTIAGRAEATGDNETAHFYAAEAKRMRKATVSFTTRSDGTTKLTLDPAPSKPLAHAVPYGFCTGDERKRDENKAPQAPRS